MDDGRRRSMQVMLDLAVEWADQDEQVVTAVPADGTGTDWYLCGQSCQFWLAVVERALADASEPSVVLVEDGLVVQPPTGPTWTLLALRAVLDALTTTEPAALRAKLLTAGAMFPRWVEDLDRRATQPAAE